MIFKLILLAILIPFIISIFFYYEILTFFELLVLRKRMKKLGYHANWRKLRFQRFLDKNSKIILCFMPNQFDGNWIVQVNNLDSKHFMHIDTLASSPSEVLEMVVEVERSKLLDGYVPFETRFLQMKEELRDKIISNKCNTHYLRTSVEGTKIF